MCVTVLPSLPIDPPIKPPRSPKAPTKAAALPVAVPTIEAMRAWACDFAKTPSVVADYAVPAALVSADVPTAIPICLLRSPTVSKTLLKSPVFP